MLPLVRSSCRRVVGRSTKDVCGNMLRLLSFEVGTPVDISYMKDVPNPVIKPDEEYPDWVFELTKPLPSKRELLQMIEKDGMESVSTRNLKLTKRRLTIEQIKQNNMTKGL